MNILVNKITKREVIILISLVLVGCILYTLYNKRKQIENFKQVKMPGCKDTNNKVYHESSTIKLTGTFDNLLNNITIGVSDKLSQINLNTFDTITNCIIQNQPIYFENKFWAGKYKEKNIFHKSFLTSNIMDMNVTNIISGNPINNNILFYKVDTGQPHVYKLRLPSQPDKFIGNFVNNRYFSIVNESSALEFEINQDSTYSSQSNPQMNIKIVNSSNSAINNKFISFEYDNNINDIKLVLKKDVDNKCIFYEHTRFDIIIFENNVVNNYKNGINSGYGNRFTISKPIQQGYNNIESNEYPFNGDFGGYRNLNYKVKLIFFNAQNYLNKSNNNEKFNGNQFSQILDGPFFINKRFNSFIIQNNNTPLLNTNNEIEKILLFYGVNKQGYIICMPSSNTGSYDNNSILTNGNNQLLFQDIGVRSLFHDNMKRVTVLINGNRITNINDLNTSINNIQIDYFNIDTNMKNHKDNKGCSNLYQSFDKSTVKNNDECRLKCIESNDCRVSEYNGNEIVNNCLLFKDCGSQLIDKNNYKVNIMDIENFSNYESYTPDNRYDTYNTNGPEIPLENYLKEDFVSYKSPRDGTNIKTNFICDVSKDTDNKIDEETGNLTNYECSILCNQNKNCNYYSHTVDNQDDSKNNCKLYDDCKNLKESKNSILQCKNDSNISCGNSHFKFPKTQFQKDIEQTINNSISNGQNKSPPISLSFNKVLKDFGVKDDKITKINKANEEISRIQRT